MKGGRYGGLTGQVAPNQLALGSIHPKVGQVTPIYKK